MSTDVTTTKPAAPQVMVPKISWTNAQIATLQNTIAKGTTKEEFEQFYEYCKAKQLDPFAKHIIVLIFNAKKSNRQVSYVTTQAGLQVIAARCGDYHPAQPGDTVFEIDEYETERQRLLGEAKRIFEKDKRTARLIEISQNMPADPTNPNGIIKATIKLYKAGVPVEGYAYWKEYAPLKPDPRCFEWKDTGETYPDGKPVKKKYTKEGMNPDDHLMLDDSGQWYKMGHVMIGKCANMQGLRAGWPAYFGAVYSEEEFDRSRQIELTATEMVEVHETERRMKAIGADPDSYSFDDGREARHVPHGKFADAVLARARECATKSELDSLFAKTLNVESMRLFWANHKGDALELKRQLEGIKGKLPVKREPVTIEHDEHEGVPAHA